MVCVKSVKLPLDDFILQVKKRKVNRLTGNFTVCLQDLRKCRICLQTVQKNEISLSLTETRLVMKNTITAFGSDLRKIERCIQMNMQDFINAYAQSIMEALKNKSLSIYNLSPECQHCPLYDLCHADDAEDKGCADFIAQHISDIKEYRVH